MLEAEKLKITLQIGHHFFLYNSPKTGRFIELAKEYLRLRPPEAIESHPVDQWANDPAVEPITDLVQTLRCGLSNFQVNWVLNFLDHVLQPSAETKLPDLIAVFNLYNQLAAEEQLHQQGTS